MKITFADETGNILKKTKHTATIVSDEPIETVRISPKNSVKFLKQ